MAKVAQLLTVILLGIIAGMLVRPANGATGLSDQELKDVSAEFDRAIQRYDDWLSRMYELTPEQKEQVHKHMLELKQAQLEWGPGAETEMNAISKELRYYIEQARQGKTLDKQKVQDLQDRMVGMVTKAPLSMNSVIAESEKFLTPEQIQAGRQRIAEYNERIVEMQERQKSMLPEAPPTDVDVLKPYLRSDPYAGMPGVLPPASTQPVAETPKPVAGPAVASGPAAASSAPAVADPADIGDTWTRYVETFISKYQLDGRQQQQSWQIHGELKKRAEEYRTAHRSDYEAVDRIENKNLAAQELKDLNKSILDMFAEMKTRLDSIPTEEQRKVADAAQPVRPTASQKALASAPSSRPGAASQPTKAPARPGARPTAKVPASRPAGPISTPAPAAAK